VLHFFVTTPGSVLPDVSGEKKVDKGCPICYRKLRTKKFRKEVSTEASFVAKNKGGLYVSKTILAAGCMHMHPNMRICISKRLHPV
jgi:hypothetical protein